MARKHGFMEWDLFTRIIDDAAAIPSITSLAISGLGEQLLHPRYVDMVAYARRANADWVIETYTNGVLLTPETFEEIKAAGMEYVSISLNAVRPEQHEAVMGLRGKFELVCANIEYAIAHRGDVNILIKAVADRSLFTNEDSVAFTERWGKWEFPKTIREAKGRTGGMVVRQANWAGAGETIRPFDMKEGCRRAYEQIAVDRNGIVLLCCFDPLGKHPFGDLKAQTIREVYNSEAYLKFRQTHFDDHADEIETCRGCTRV
jgi:radical SAM protein with 4Fe4S-binding SPASM domain